MSDDLQTLVRLLSTPPKSIEIIPGTGQEWSDFVTDAVDQAQALDNKPFLWFDGHLGVPEKILYKLYVQALNAFVALRSTHTEIGLIGLQITSVVLLANPSHQTALNTRKRLVRTGIQTAEDELLYVAALLSLRQSAKVSILWHHRRWILLHRYGTVSEDFSNTVLTDIDDEFCSLKLPPALYKTELDIISKACDNHMYPRNYYAWTHRQLIIQSCAFSWLATIESLSAPYTNGDKDHDESCASELLQELFDIKLWIQRHVSDFSAIHYLCQFMILLHSLSSSIASQDISHASTELLTEVSISAQGTLEHAFELVQAYPKHESLWLYLRSAICMHEAYQRNTSDSDATHRESKITSWVTQLTQIDMLNTKSTDDQTNVNHAQAFLRWLSSYKESYTDNIRSS